MATSSEAKVFNVGIIGYGLSAKVFHIPFIALTSNLKLHSILQRNPVEGNSAPADHPSAAHFTSPEPFLSDPALDLVVLCTPPNTHYPLALAALQADKHLLVEKPFVPTAAQADELVALVRARHRQLCVYHNRRWDADFQTLQTLLRDDALGRVYELNTHFDRFRPAPPDSWKGALAMDDGGGVLFDLGTHLLDQVYVLFGLPTAVSGRFVNQRQGRAVDGVGEQPDSVSAVLSYADGSLLVVVRAGVMSVEARQPRFWARGTKGSYHKCGLDAQEGQLRDGMGAGEEGFGREEAVWDGTLCRAHEDGSITEERLPNVPPETYLKFYEMLGKSLETGKEEDVPVPASQAADVLRIIAAIRESARVGKDVQVSRT